MGNSRLRPETCDAPGSYAPTGAAAYYAIYNAVQAEDRLIHGRLYNPKGEHCAIGAYFSRTGAALDARLIDEIATINDSVAPGVGGKKRRQVVMRYLRWKLQTLGFPLPGRKVQTP